MAPIVCFWGVGAEEVRALKIHCNPCAPEYAAVEGPAVTRERADLKSLWFELVKTGSSHSFNFPTLGPFCSDEYSDYLHFGTCLGNLTRMDRSRPFYILYHDSPNFDGF